MGLKKLIDDLIRRHRNVLWNLPRRELIRLSVALRECLVTKTGALATWTPADSTGRSPLDTVMVQREENKKEVDWDFPNNRAIEESTFDMLVADAVEVLAGKEQLFVTKRVLGADPAWALPVQTISGRALTALFTDNMFRRIPEDIDDSIYEDQPFTILVMPFDKLDPERYEGRLRIDPDTGKVSTMVIAMDLERRLGVIYGSSYNGSVKKMIFTVMNYYLPAAGILPLHCSANEGPDNDSALLLGLSGTGKTTLSADPDRKLLGDDEHGWSDNGVANFEGGCYAKLINLDMSKEPEIHHAVFHEADYLDHGAVIENTMIYLDGRYDLDDDRLTANSRASYPLEFLRNVKTPPVSGHPKTILFLTADANGVLPPISRLSKNQARLWFLMGYTSKVAGTETSIVEPRSTFSRFFGAPFMPLMPSVYSKMLGDKMDQHNVDVYLVNTGWTGGGYGVGKRMDINLTRAMVRAALNGELKGVEYEDDPIFRVAVPTTCPGVPDPALLRPINVWPDREVYLDRARKLAGEFHEHFLKAFAGKGILDEVAAECPGRD